MTSLLANPESARFKVFEHLLGANRAAYRQMLGVFVSAQQRFTIALRPADVAEGIAAAGSVAPSQNEIAAALAQLVEWGNLTATQDTADVSTVEEFYRARASSTSSPRPARRSRRPLRWSTSTFSSGAS